MICPFCNSNKDKVIDSRSSEGGTVIRRRRHCLNCKRRFTTYERVEQTNRLVVIKRDGSREPFDLEKIVKGILLACGKRPVPEEVKRRLAEEVEEEVHQGFDREVRSDEVGKRVAAKLRELDRIAYLRFASEYYGFRTLEEFEAELKDLRDMPSPAPDQPDLFDAR